MTERDLLYARKEKGKKKYYVQVSLISLVILPSYLLPNNNSFTKFFPKGIYFFNLCMCRIILLKKDVNYFLFPVGNIIILI